MPALEKLRKAAEQGSMPSVLELMAAIGDVSDTAYVTIPDGQQQRGCEKPSCSEDLYHPGRVCSSC